MKPFSFQPEKQNNNRFICHTFRRSNIAKSFMRIGDANTETSWLRMVVVILWCGAPWKPDRMVAGYFTINEDLHCVINGDILEADNHAYDTVLSTDLVKVLLVTEEITSSKRYSR